MSVQPVQRRQASSERDRCDLSILTPSYGYAQFLPDAIASVKGQRAVSVEHVIQDGASTDGTVALLESYGEGDLLWRSEPDQGQSDALNRALQLAGGRWVGWLNADEFYLPSGLERLVAAGDAAGADVVYGDAIFVDGEGRMQRLLPEHAFNRFVLTSWGPFIQTASLIVRRSALGSDPIDASMRRMMDWDLFLRMAREGARFLYVPVPVGVFRAHDTRVTATERRVFLRPLHLGDGFGREYAMLRERYGALRRRRLGHLVHGALKLGSGSYRRQLRARGLRGADMRWFRSPEAMASCERLLECYR